MKRNERMEVVFIELQQGMNLCVNSFSVCRTTKRKFWEQI
jgi:hypothetical protein